jgi:hypothetical protein
VTVIACNLREMAADSLIDVSDARPYRTSKLTRLPDGSIVGVCGTGYEFLVEWLKAGEIVGNQPEHKEKQDYQVLRLTRSGIFIYVNSHIADKCKDRVMAIGSGSNVAMYAMRFLKKPPSVAVRESIKVSPGCAGPIDVMRLKAR